MATQRNTKPPKTTVIADDPTQDQPQSTSPGDAPADTYDGDERVSSAPVDKGAAAEAGHLTANAVVKTGRVERTEPSGTRTETVTVYDNDNQPVEVTRNYDTGVTTVPEPDPGDPDPGDPDPGDPED